MPKLYPKRLFKSRFCLHELPRFCGFKTILKTGTSEKRVLQEFPFFFSFLSAYPQRNTFPFSPFPPPEGDSREKGKKGKRKILDFPSRIFFKSQKAKKSSKKKEQACSSSNCTNIFSAFLLTCCEKYQDYCKMRTFEQSVTNETFLSFFI